METSSIHNLPPLFLLLAAILVVLVVVLQVGLLGYAYEKIGIKRSTAYLILILSLLGSYVNLPIAEAQPSQPSHYRLYQDDLGMARLEPLGTTIALNVGGAIVPTLLSVYLLVKHQLYIPAIAGTAFVAAVVHWLAEVVPGAGVTVPILAPPIVSAGISMILSRHYAAPLAYIAGSVGTLIGADLLNLFPLVETGAQAINIGGEGTFDALFLTGILAVLLAVSPRPVSQDDLSPSDT